MTLGLEKAQFRLRSKTGAPDAEVIGRLLEARSSCRRFRPDPVPRETTEQILGLAQLTASWCNSQSWGAIVIEGGELSRFSAALLSAVTSEDPELGQPAYHNRTLERRRETGWQLYEAVGVTRGDRAGSRQQLLENFRFFGAPQTMVITSDRDLGVYGAVDCGGYVANLMLIATSFGVDTIAQAAIATKPTCVREFLGIPEDRVIVCGISFGYRDQSHPANSFTTRRDGIEHVVQWRS